MNLKTLTYATVFGAAGLSTAAHAVSVTFDFTTISDSIFTDDLDLTSEVLGTAVQIDTTFVVGERLGTSATGLGVAPDLLAFGNNPELTSFYQQVIGFTGLNQHTFTSIELGSFDQPFTSGTVVATAGSTVETFFLTGTGPNNDGIHTLDFTQQFEELLVIPTFGEFTVASVSLVPIPLPTTGMATALLALGPAVALFRRRREAKSQ